MDRLDAESLSRQVSRSELAKTLIEEGLRMEEHPGIIFRAGPAGRRPGLSDGPDIWEIARLFLGESLDVHASDSQKTIARTAELMALTPRQVETAMRYYASYRDEIDAWIGRVDEYAERSEASWRREQGILAGLGQSS